MISTFFYEQEELINYYITLFYTYLCINKRKHTTERMEKIQVDWSQNIELARSIRSLAYLNRERKLITTIIYHFTATTLAKIKLGNARCEKKKKQGIERGSIYYSCRREKAFWKHQIVSNRVVYTAS